MAKFCTNCGKEIDENAAICLNCGVIIGNDTKVNQNTNNNNNTSKKKKGLPVWAIVLIVVGSVLLIPLILFIIVGITYAKFSTTTEQNDYYDDDSYYEDYTTKRGTIEDTIEIGDFEITLNEALMYSKIEGSSYYDDIPDYGNEYLIFFLDVKNISNSESYISDYSFEGYADGEEVDVIYLFNDVNGHSDLDEYLSPGRRTKGYVAFEVDKSWDRFELSYEDWYSGEKAIFSVLNNDSSV